MLFVLEIIERRKPLRQVNPSQSKLPENRSTRATFWLLTPIRPVVSFPVLGTSFPRLTPVT